MKERYPQGRQSVYDYSSDIIYPGFKWLLNSCIEVNTGKTEEEIPKDKSLSVIVGPHMGWGDIAGAVLGMENALPEIRPMIFSKESNRFLAFALGNKNMAWIDRDNPSHHELRSLYNKLENRNSVIVTAGEGTRKGNPEDENDILTLTDFKPGPIVFAMKFKLELVTATILGSENISPLIDEAVKKGEYKKALDDLIHVLKGGHQLEVRYRHIKRTDQEIEEDSKLRGEIQKDRIKFLNNQVATNIVEDIMEMRPDFPLGPYEYLRS
jgi:hypothetical protein